MGRAKGGASAKIKRMPKTEAQRAQERVATLAERIGIPAEQRGNLVEGKIVDLAGELGAKMTVIPVLINRGGTAVERWINGDKAGLFEEPQQRAIRYTQQLWARRCRQPRRGAVAAGSAGRAAAAQGPHASPLLGRLRKRLPVR